MSGPLVGLKAGVFLSKIKSRPELNGAPVVATSYDPDRERYAVRLPNGVGMRVKPDNVEFRPHDTSGAACAHQHGEMLEARGAHVEAANAYLSIVPLAGELYANALSTVWTNVGLAYKRARYFVAAYEAYANAIYHAESRTLRELSIANLCQMLYQCVAEPVGSEETVQHALLSTMFRPHLEELMAATGITSRPLVSLGHEPLSAESRRADPRDFYLAASWAPPTVEAAWAFSLSHRPEQGVRRLNAREISELPTALTAAFAWTPSVAAAPASRDATLGYLRGESKAVQAALGALAPRPRATRKAGAAPAEAEAAAASVRAAQDSHLSRRLIEAARAGDAGEAERCLEAGASAESQQPGGYTALGLAVHRGHLQVVEQLLRRRASPDTPVCADGATPLMTAAAGNRIEIVGRLLAHRAALELRGTAASGHRGCTALDVATQRGHHEVAALLTRERRERALRHLARIRRLVPAVGGAAAALRELHLQVRYRPGGEGARQAQRHFHECCAELAV